VFARSHPAPHAAEPFIAFTDPSFDGRESSADSNVRAFDATARACCRQPSVLLYRPDAQRGFKKLQRSDEKANRAGAAATKGRKPHGPQGNPGRCAAPAATRKGVTWVLQRRQNAATGL
jgi:hypothetical protein